MKADVAPPPGVKRQSLFDEVIAIMAFTVTVIAAVPIAVLVTPFRVVTGWFTRRGRR